MLYQVPYSTYWTVRYVGTVGREPRAIIVQSRVSRVTPK